MIESALLKRGVHQLKIRKWAQAIAAVGQSFFAIGFGFCRTAPLAALFINAENVCSLAVQAGFNQNMIEVGGADTATLNAVGNSMGNSWGLIVPLLSVYCKRRWGTYAPVFIQAAVFHSIGSVLFCRFAQLTSLAERKAAAAAAVAVAGRSKATPRLIRG